MKTCKTRIETNLSLLQVMVDGIVKVETEARSKKVDISSEELDHALNRAFSTCNHAYNLLLNKFEEKLDSEDSEIFCPHCEKDI